MTAIRKSTKQHLLQGTEPEYNKDSELVVATVQAGRPVMPKTLTPLAQEKWVEVVRILRKRGTLTKGDGTALELFCEDWARWRQSATKLAEEGDMILATFYTKDGEEYQKRIVNPLCKIVTALGSSLRATIKEFSLTPATRERTKKAGVAPPKEKPLPPGMVRI